MKIFINIAAIFFLSVIWIIVSTGAFVGAGYALSSALPLTLFQCSALSIGATFVSVFIILAFLISKLFMGIMRAKSDNFSYKDEEEDEEDGDEEEEEVRPPSDRRKFTVISNKRVGRNEICPCGSGKKYKYCCGK